MIVLSAIKLHGKSGIVVNLNIYACLGKVIVRQTPFAVKHHTRVLICSEKERKKKWEKKAREKERARGQETV